MAAARSRVALWGLVLLTAGLLELKCGHKRYDHKKSSEMFCTMIKRGEGWWGGYTDASCFVPDAPCFYAGTIQFLSPRWLGQFSGNGGPLLTWVPLLLLNDGTRRIKSALVTTLVWYLALISIVRHFRTQTVGPHMNCGFGRRIRGTILGAEQTGDTRDKCNPSRFLGNKGR